MRGVSFLVCLALVVTVMAQEPVQITGLFATVRPQILVLARQHAAGPEMLEITAIEPGYPPELLREQATKIGKAFGGEARALTVYYQDLDPGGGNLRFLKATLAIDGLIGPDGSVGLTELVRAFAGAPKPHTVSGIAITLEGIKPTPQTVRNFSSAFVAVEGKYQRSPEMLEYRIRLDTQKPEEITVALEPFRTEPKPVGKERQDASAWLVWTLVGLSGIGAGALVYFMLAKRPSKGGD